MTRQIDGDHLVVAGEGGKDGAPRPPTPAEPVNEQQRPAPALTNDVDHAEVNAWLRRKTLLSLDIARRPNTGVDEG